MKARILFAVLVLASGSFFTSATSAEGQFESWYQVDVIVFKPKTTDLDEESWPEPKSVYPADVTAVTGAEVFKLSQLEQLESLILQDSQEEVSALGSGDFAFEGLGNRNRNRRVIERATGMPEVDDATGVSPTTGLIDDQALPDATTTEDIIDGLLAARSADSAGQLAFSDREANSSLQAILRSLRRSSRFTVLGNHSWVQPIDSEATPILIQAGKRYDDRYEIEGTLSFNRSRFLHVQTNLWYTLFEPRGGNANPYLGGFQSTLSNEVLSENPALVEVERERGQFYAARTHAMFQTRRMRSDELHYIDHPLFGIIVRINRFSPET